MRYAVIFSGGNPNEGGEFCCSGWFSTICEATLYASTISESRCPTVVMEVRMPMFVERVEEKQEVVDE